jgi:hypothetical protein
MRDPRLLIVSLLLLCISLVAEVRGESANAPVAVGAIRWDGWHSDADSVGKAVAKSLGPEEFHYRIPFFGTLDKDGNVAVNGDNAAVMEREIAYAKAAHLDYWAFINYPEGNVMNRGLELYLASPHRADVHFCIISETGHWQPNNIEAMAKRYAALMAEPGYQTTPTGRPLFFFLNHGAAALKKVWGEDDAKFRPAVEALRKAAHDRGLADPYTAVMTWDKIGAQKFAAATGIDAISAYAFQGGAHSAPYAKLPPVVENFWEEQRRTGAKVIPLAMSGWDRRPRIKNPVPWEHFAAAADQYYEPATAEQFAEHLGHAVAWCRSHPDVAEAQAVIIYAWNEHDEGGWLCPTLRTDGSPDTSRIDALGKVLRP